MFVCVCVRVVPCACMFLCCLSAHVQESVCVCVSSVTIFIFLSCLLQTKDSAFELDSIDIPKTSYMTDV